MDHNASRNEPQTFFKEKTMTRFTCTLAAVTCVGLLATAASQTQAAVTYYWDTNGATPGVGGTGVWNLSNQLFTTDSAGESGHVAWDNTANPPNDAVFNTSGGAVSFSGNPTLNFGTATFNANYGLAKDNDSNVTLNGDVQINNNSTLTMFRNGSLPSWTVRFNQDVSGGTLSLRGGNTGTNLFALELMGTMTSAVSLTDTSAGQQRGLFGTSSTALVSGNINVSTSTGGGSFYLGATSGSQLTSSGNLLGTKAIVVAPTRTDTSGGMVKLTSVTGSTYNGTITVQGGTLDVTGNYGSANVVVRNAAIASGGSQILAGTGTVKTITLNSAGAVAPGNSSIGTLNTNNGNVTWNGDAGSFAQMKFELDNTSNLALAATADRIALGTGVFTKGTAGLFQFDFLNTGAVNNTYTLLTFGSSTGFTVGDFSYTNLGGGLSGDFILNANSLQFAIIPEPASLALLGLGGLLMLPRRRREA